MNQYLEIPHIVKFVIETLKNSYLAQSGIIKNDYFLNYLMNERGNELPPQHKFFLLKILHLDYYLQQNF